ncbi:MAG: hypothetical protein WBX49_12025 [Candidatus Deferrimicrobiaceae bacterium]
MRKLWALFLSLVFAASFSLAACAKKEAPPPPPPPAEQPAPADKGAMMPADNAAMPPAGMEKPMEEPKK